MDNEWFKEMFPALFQSTTDTTKAVLTADMIMEIYEEAKREVCNMKLLACDQCGAVVPLHWVVKGCTCGNIKGRYKDNLIAEVTVCNKETSRVIGFENGVRFGNQPYGQCFIIDWNNSHLIMKEEE
jgi:hypothetical protein